MRGKRGKERRGLGRGMAQLSPQALRISCTHTVPSRVLDIEMTLLIWFGCTAHRNAAIYAGVEDPLTACGSPHVKVRDPLCVPSSLSFRMFFEPFRMISSDSSIFECLSVVSSGCVHVLSSSISVSCCVVFCVPLQPFMSVMPLSRRDAEAREFGMERVRLKYIANAKVPISHKHHYHFI